MSKDNAKLILTNDLIVTDLVAADKWEAIDKLSALHLGKGYVREEYAAKVREREEGFPTGLPTTPFGVAIPHTWAEHCIKPAVAVGILKEPVKWLEMGTLDKELDVNIVLLLSITEPEAQVHFLRQLIDFFIVPENLEKLMNNSGVESVKEILKTGLPLE